MNDLYILLEAFNFVRNMRLSKPDAEYFFFTDDNLLFELFNDHQVREKIISFDISNEDDVLSLKDYRYKMS